MLARATRNTDAHLLREARRVVADLRPPVPWIYWSDLLATAALTWGAVWIGPLLVEHPFWTVIDVVAVGLALTRATMFLHELAHLPRRALPQFHVAWNLLLGVPFGVPSFIWESSHLDHHKRTVYRTPRDPEHAPDDRAAAVRVVTSVMCALCAPIVLASRWLVVAPVSLAHPRLRKWVVEHASTLTMNRTYRPRRLRGRLRIEAGLTEFLSFSWFALLAAGVLAGRLPVRGVLVAAGGLAFASAAVVLRGEILHRFSGTHTTGTLAAQVFESVTVAHAGVLSALLLPLGIGYHALHHLDPKLPYHSLRKAHLRLLASLPDGWAYHRTVSRDLLSATREAVNRALSARGHGESVAPHGG